jgi:hypothetical protein
MKYGRGCNHANSSHSVLSFSHSKVIISFGVESVKLLYILRLIIYHWNMGINLKDIQ